ncbi:MAG: GntR family transcriptional regulator [Deltaproteobacteria bacterium]
MLKQDELVLAIKEMITRHPGQRLPSERSLAVNLGVSRARIRQVLDRLESEQLVTRQRGSGNYAVDLRKDRLTTVGILVDRQLKLGNDPFYSMLLEQLQGALQHEGIRSVIERIDDDSKLPEGEDALIIMGMAGNRVIETQNENLPILGIFLDAKPSPGTQVSILQVDNLDAGYQAAN